MKKKKSVAATTIAATSLIDLSYVPVDDALGEKINNQRSDFGLV